MEGNAALIPIHPIYAERIISGQKRLEFRRRWPARHVDFLVIYATAPVKKIVAVAKVGEVIRGSRNKLWSITKNSGIGISRRALFSYMEGIEEGVALKFSKAIKIDDGLNPLLVFGIDFRPPQFFRYLRQAEIDILARQLKDMVWESYL
jgi:predicted transcriptional regulator